MGQTTDQIETDIQHTREDLRSNLQELEQKVKSVTDWKEQFQNHPGTMVAAAFGAGALVATLGRRRKSGKEPATSSTQRTDSPAAIRAGKHEVLETWDNVKSALVGVAATQVTGFLGRLVPGFQEQLKKAQSAQHSSPPSASLPKGPVLPSH
jgi:hypothetical protein